MTLLLCASREDADEDIKAIQENAEKNRSRPLPPGPEKKKRRKEKLDEGSPVRPRRLEYDDAVDFSDEGGDEAQDLSGQSEDQETGSEDDDLFKGKYGRATDGKKDDEKPASKPLEDTSAAPSTCSPWDSLPSNIREKLQQITAELLDLLPVSECT